MAGWQKLCEGMKAFTEKFGLFSSNIKIWFTHFLEDFWQEKCTFWSKTVFLGQEVHYNMVKIAYYTELNVQICNYAQKRRICCENSKYSPEKNFFGQFCPRRKAANLCHPGQWHAWPLHQSYYLKKNPGADQAIQHLYVWRCNNTIWFWRDPMFCSHFCFLTFSWPFAKSL